MIRNKCVRDQDMYPIEVSTIFAKSFTIFRDLLEAPTSIFTLGSPSVIGTLVLNDRQAPIETFMHLLIYSIPNIVKTFAKSH